jgi:hypothetical protein
MIDLGRTVTRCLSPFRPAPGSLLLEVEVLDPERHRLQQPEPASIEKAGDQQHRAVEMPEQRPHLATGEDDRQPTPHRRPHHSIEPGDIHLEYHLVEEEQGRECLRLRGRADPPPLGEVGEEGGQLVGSELARWCRPWKRM